MSLTISRVHPAAASDPSSVHASYNVGYLAHELGRLRSAIAHYRRETKQSNYYKAHYNLGTIWLEQGKYQRAVAEFNAALKSCPTLSAAYNNLGIAYSRLGDRRRELAAYAQAARLDRRDPVPLVNLGLALVRRGRLAKGRAVLRRAVRLRRKDTETLRWLGYALIEARLSPLTAVEFLERARRRRPKDAGICLDLAGAYSAIGKTERASALARRAQSLAANNRRVSGEARRMLRLLNR